MNLKKLFVLVFFVLFVLLGAFVLVSLEDDSLKLEEGKNKIRLNFSDAFYVDSLIKLNPDIEVVSYIDEYNQSTGYVNIFGGIGENFVIYPNAEYEIITRKDFNLVLPYS